MSDQDGKAKVAKEMIEAIDAERNLITFKVIEGDVLEHYKSFKITIHATPKAHGQGSIVHWTMEYEKHHGDIEDPHTLLQFAVDVCVQRCRCSSYKCPGIINYNRRLD